jgi:spermidine/putrescine transport system ATP-binding protein
VAKDEVERRVREAMRLVDLEGFERRKPGQMSGGQQQRVALARALVNHPKVLLLDEPLGALDLKLRKQMQLELKRIQREVGITFIYVTHDQEEAMTMSDRLAVMRHGKIEQLGHPEDVYESPATEFVAGFLGASNLLEGELKDHQDGRATVQLSAGTVVSVASDRVPPDAVGRVKVGVRPEKITIHRNGAGIPSDVNAVSGLLRMATYIGVSHQYEVEGPGGSVITVYAQNLGSDVPGSPGERVVLTWRPEHTFAVVPQDDLDLEPDEGEL